MNKPGRRVSSLEAAGVKSSSSTTSSSSSTAAQSKKKLPTPISTTKIIRTSNTPTSSPIVSQRLTKTPTRTKPTTVNTQQTIPLSKKRPAGTGTPTTPTVRSASRASNYHGANTLPSSSRTSTSSSTSTTILKRKSVVAPTARRQSFTADSLAIESLKDKNTTIQKALSEKEQLLIEKENDLKNIKAKLEKLQHEIGNNNQQQLGQEAMLSKSEMENVQEVHKEQELLEKIKLLQCQSDKQKQSSDNERIEYAKKLEEAELESRKIIEKLKEKLESEKSILTTKTMDKEREIEKLKKDMDEMRDNIRDMHQSHQTRLTTLTSQLSQQHSENLDKLRFNYEERPKQNTKGNGKEEQQYFNYKSEFEKKSKELDLLQSKFNELNLSTEKEKEGITTASKEAIELLEIAHKENVQKLLGEHAETEASRKAELDQYKIKLQMSNAKVLQVEEDLRKNRSVRLDVTQINEEYLSKIEQLKEAHEIEKNDVANKFREEYEFKLKLEKYEFNGKYEELKKSLADKLKDIEKTREKNALLAQKVQNMERKVSNNEQVIAALQKKQLDLEEQVAYERSRYEESVRNNDVLKTALSSTESRVAEKDAEMKTSLNDLETKHNLIIKDIKEEHQKVILNLKKDHAKDMKLAEHQTNTTCADIEIFETKLQKVEESKQQLEEELLKIEKQLISQSEEQEAKLTQAKHEASEIQKKYSRDQESQRIAYVNQIDEVKSKLRNLESELKNSNDKYNQSMQELRDAIINETFPHTELVHLNSETKEEELNASSMMKLIKEVFVKKNEELYSNKSKNLDNNETTHTKLQIIIEQHQKELIVLQNQFQSLLDMKDRELEDLSYGIKSRNGSVSVDLSDSFSTSASEESKAVESELRKQLHNLEEDVKSKSLEMRWLESDSEQNEIKIKDQGTLIYNLQLNNNKLDNYIQQLRDENDQMLRLIHQLQGEIHHL